MDDIALYAGYSVMVAGALFVVGMALFWSAMVFNRGVRWALDAYGGLKVFMDYKEWYHKNKVTSHISDEDAQAQSSYKQNAISPKTYDR